MALPSSAYVGIGSTFLVQCPQLVVGYLPTMIAILELRRPIVDRRTWIIWACVAIALPMPLLYEARSIARFVLDPGVYFHDAIGFAGKLLALVASFAIAKRTEPAWRRLFGGSTDNQDPEGREVGRRLESESGLSP